MKENNINDWVKGLPLKSGNYIIKRKDGSVGRDHYSAEKKIWWNTNPEYYSPSSYMSL